MVYLEENRVVVRKADMPPSGNSKNACSREASAQATVGEFSAENHEFRVDCTHSSDRELVIPAVPINCMKTSTFAMGSAIFATESIKCAIIFARAVSGSRGIATDPGADKTTRLDQWMRSTVNTCNQ
jgi:hypothetical protein